MSSFEKCTVTLNLAGKIRPTEIREAASEYERDGMATDAALLQAVEDQLALAQMDEKRISKAVRDAYEARGGKKADAVVAAKEESVDIKLSRRTIEVDGVRRPIDNSEGRPVAQGFKEQQAFWEFFGDSKVTDDTSHPLVVYHGTTGNFDEFAPETGWFTVAPSEANMYGGFDVEGANVMPAYVKIESPRMIDGDKSSNWRSDIFDALTDGSIDGVIVTKDGKPHWVVPVEPTQIKSATGNSGAFDAGNPDVRMSRRQTETPEFKRWFGDSKVVDADGNPKVVYHGTRGDFSVFDYSRIGDQGRAEGAGFYFTNSKDVASGYGKPMEIYLSIQKPLAYNAKPFSKAVVEKIVKRIAEIESQANGMDIGDGFLSNFGDVNYEGLSAVIKDAAKLISSDETALDQLSGIVGSGVSPAYVNQATKEITGHDGVIAKGFSNSGDEGNTIFVAFFPSQIKSAIDNAGTFSSESDDIRMSRRQQSIQGQQFLLNGETFNEEKRRQIQDYFIRVKAVQEQLALQGGVVSEKQDVYQAEELSYGRIQEQMREFKSKVVEPLLKDVQKRKLTLPELAMYAYAKHAPERNAAMQAINPKLPPGTGSGMTNTEARQIIAQFRTDGKLQDLEDLHNQLMVIASTTRQLLLVEGLITQEEFDAWDSKYDNYVPLRGFVEDETDVVDGVEKKHVRGAGKGFNIRGAESTRALGRTSEAGHVIENILNDYERAVVRVERNDVAKVFLNLVTTNPDSTLWEIDARRTTAAFNKGTQTVTYNQLIDKGEDTVSVKLAGKEVYIKVNDPLLVRALRQASTDETGATTRILMQSLGWYTAWMRNVLTRFNPAFGFSNAVKDFGFGAVSILADLGPKGAALYAKHYATSAGANARNEFDRVDMTKAVDRQYAEFRAAGATTGGYHMRDLQEMRKELQNLIVEYGGQPVTLAQKLIATKGINQAYTASKKILRMLELIGALSENQARFAAFRAAREMGKSPAQAASIAKNLTTNFNRKGEWGSALNTLYLFFNAGVQGTDKMLKNLQNPQVQALMAGTVGVTVGLAMLGALVGGDDDDGQPLWDKIPQFEKERNLIIMLPPEVEVNGAERVGKNGRYIKIPVQYGLNVFTNLGYTIADVIRNVNDKTAGVTPGRAALNTVSSIFASFNPLGGAVDLSSPTSVGMALAPSVADVGIQLGAGVDSFNRPTSPAKSPFDKKPDSENFGPSMIGTWEQRLAAWMNDHTGGDAAVSGVVDVAPGTLRNVKRNVVGGTGDFLSSVFVNIPSKLTSPGAEFDNRDLPVLKAFYGEADSNTNLGLYYDRKAESELAKYEADQRKKLDINATYTDEELGMQAIGERAKLYTVKMTRLKKEEIEIRTDPKLTEQERNLGLLQINKDRATFAREFNAEYMGMKKDVAKK